MREQIELDVPESAWEESGDSEDGRMLATVSILGALHHLEAVPVETSARADDYAEQVGEPPDYFDELYKAFGGDGAFSTVMIKGKQYCLFMSPFCV